MEKNILIVNYNTTELTNACIFSINKRMPGYNIYVFDNSDKVPYENTYFDNVTIIDNTKGWYVNFAPWLKEMNAIPNSGARKNNYGSAKHCVSVDIGFLLIGRDVILMDSDVLLKKDCSDIIDKRCVYSSEIAVQPNCDIRRVLPFLCYMNYEMCRMNGIRFFDKTHMHGLNNGKYCDRYDTGAGFYLQCEDLKHKEIKCDEYIEHYAGGSWVKEKLKQNHRHTPLYPCEWILRNKSLWYTDSSECRDFLSKIKTKATMELRSRGGKPASDKPHPHPMFKPMAREIKLIKAW